MSHQHQTNDVISAFNDAMYSADIGTDEQIIADGQIRYYTSINDKPKSKKCWYVLHDNHGFFAGAFGSCKLDFKQTWCSKPNHQLSPAERNTFSQLIKQAKRKHQLEIDHKHAQARQQADGIWLTSFEVAGHPYLTTKQVKPYGIKLSGDSLVIPLRDTSGQLHSLQFIKPNGSKLLLSGGAKTSHFHLIGKPNDVLLVCEGYSTGATLYECTGYPVGVAIDAGNLKSVGQSLRKAYPGIKLVFCADNDQYGPFNVGVDKATQAAESVNGFLIIPEFKDTSTKPTDYNDLYCLDGTNSVSKVA